MSLAGTQKIIAVQKVVSISGAKPEEVCDHLEIPGMLSHEITFFIEYTDHSASLLTFFKEKRNADPRSDYSEGARLAPSWQQQTLALHSWSTVGMQTLQQQQSQSSVCGGWKKLKEEMWTILVLATCQDPVDAGWIVLSEEGFFSFGPGISSFTGGVTDEVQKYLEGTSESLDCLNDFPMVRSPAPSYPRVHLLNGSSAPPPSCGLWLKTSATKERKQNVLVRIIWFDC